MVEYTYTAYGKSTVLVNNSLSEDEKIIENNIIDNNIFRYKGYCYDTEVELYWLTTRYYSPELCSFISPDSVEYLDPKSINGLNLYCYCLNNPVSYVDPSGHLALSIAALTWIAFGVSAFIGGTASVISQGIATDWQDINMLQVIWDAGIAGISGALSMSSLGIVSMIAVNTTLGFIGSVGGHLIQGHDLFGENASEYWFDIGISTLISFGIGLIGGSGAQYGTNLKVLQQNFASAYDDMVTTSVKVASGYYKTAGIATIHMNKATARCNAAFLMYVATYSSILNSIKSSVLKSSIVTLGTSWRTGVM